MSTDFWQKRLFDAGYRLTAPRKLVIQILIETDKHLSVEDIYVSALKTNPSIGMATVYRTVDLFAQTGVIQKFDIGDGKARYELTNNPKKKGHHHHLICIRCKEIVDYTDFIKDEVQLMNKTETALSQKYHFQIMHHIIHFYGLCESCRNVT